MNKFDYGTVVTSMKESRPKRHKFDPDRFVGAEAQWKAIVKVLGRNMEKDNPGFKRPIFYELCGYYDLND